MSGSGSRKKWRSDTLRHDITRLNLGPQTVRVPLSSTQRAQITNLGSDEEIIGRESVGCHGVRSRDNFNFSISCNYRPNYSPVWRRFSRSQRLRKTQAAVFSVMLNKIQHKEKGDML
nr:hypothetical protein HJG63_008621 [Rousettus aegyptiacus]